VAHTPGWTKLAGPALELAALAFGSFAMDLANGSPPKPKASPKPQAPVPPPSPPSAPVSAVSAPPAPKRESGPRDFLFEIADEGANYYRASDATAELVAGLYSDGRIRLADSDGRRFAGALIGGHADLLELQRNDWSEVFLRVTPTGRMQLELRGGPYDGHVLTCEALQE
jgi:hypothetical protein